MEEKRRYFMREVTVGEILNMKNDDQELLFEVSLEEQANIRGGYRVGAEHKGDFCKLMMTMMEEGWFEMCGGKSIRNKEKFIMEIGKYLNVDLGNFYVNMSKSYNSSEETFLSPFRVLLERARKIWNKKNG